MEAHYGLSVRGEEVGGLGRGGRGGEHGWEATRRRQATVSAAMVSVTSLAPAYAVREIRDALAAAGFVTPPITPPRFRSRSPPSQPRTEVGDYNKCPTRFPRLADHVCTAARLGILFGVERQGRGGGGGGGRGESQGEGGVRSALLGDIAVDPWGLAATTLVGGGGTDGMGQRVGRVAGVFQGEWQGGGPGPGGGMETSVVKDTGDIRRLCESHGLSSFLQLLTDASGWSD
jgi:hypothetical protein